MTSHAGSFLVALSGLALAQACGAKTPAVLEIHALDDAALKQDLATLSASRVYFGHQSVGRNILDGLGALSKEAGVAVRIEDESIGQNTRPLEKFGDFARRGERNRDDGIELMAMKLCYVDFDPRTDVDALVRGYVEAVERVRKARPGIRIVHVTPPLCARPEDLKSRLNRTLGRTVWEDASNARRLAFARKLRETFPGEPFFDLAAVESTRPDGTLEEHEVEGQKIPMLWPGYTTDGGHLNDAGSRLAAKAFAHALAEALRR